MDREDLLKRTKEFALRTIRLCRALPTTPESRVIRGQLLRCSTSVGANYRAACRARSRADFVAKLGLVEEEIDESAYWLELVQELELIPQAKLSSLMEETNALVRIISASRMTARSNKTPQKIEN